jgi:serine/threonine protein kinase
MQKVMEKERWEKAKDIFEQALALATESRAKFLDEACAGDRIVRREVEELLTSFDETASFLETPAVALRNGKLENGQIFGHYEIIEQIGAGGMGEVFLAKDTRLLRRVALKLLPAELSADKEKLRRFEQEAFAASSLNHPNILTIYEIGATDQMNFIAAEFIEGETLRDQLKRGELTFERILEIAVQTVSALCAAHEAHIVHRDIKPENIMIRRDKLVKILDFGLAKTVRMFDIDESGKSLLNTKQGVIMGTVCYMSPEQTRGKDIDERSDLWSFGVVLYEMIAGRVPFEGETASDCIAAILKTSPPPLPAETPAELQRIVGKNLRQNKDERYQTAKDLLVDLKNLKQDLAFTEKLERGGTGSGLSGERKTISPGRNTDEQAAKTITSSSIEFARSNKTPVILVLIILLAGTLAAGYFLLRGKPAVIQTPESAKIDSLAVLPFENLNPETEYLSDGITESLINSLSNLPSLRVISRSTVFGFKGTKQTPQEIGRILNVHTVLTGKISQLGEQLSIQAELVDLNGSQLWGEKFEVRASDLLQTEEKIVQQITEKLQLKLDNQQKAQIAKYYTENAEAYREYLKGRYYTLQYSADGHKKALEHLNKAIEIDPTYALAYAGIADAYTTVSDWFMSPREALSKAKAAANKSLELDDQLAEAYAARGHARLHEWDKAAIDDLNKAAALAPNSLTTQLWLGEYYMIWDVEKSVVILQKAEELDPLSPIPGAFLSFDFYMLRQPEKAIASGKRSSELNPNFFTEYSYMARYFASKGDLKSAEIEVGKIPPEAADAMTFSTKGMIFAQQGKRAEAEKIVAEMQKLSATQYIAPYEFALVYLKLDNRDKVFFYLDKAFEDRSENLGFIRNVPDFDPIRDDPRYGELMRKIGFEQ